MSVGDNQNGSLRQGFWWNTTREVLIVAKTYGFTFHGSVNKTWCQDTNFWGFISTPVVGVKVIFPLVMNLIL